MQLSSRHHAVNPQLVPSSGSFAPDLGDWDPHAAPAADPSAGVGGTPRKASEPKVQMPFVCGVGEVPRKIEVERRKRAFASMDIVALLEMKWLRASDMLPGGEYVTDKIPEDGGAFLPLEFFDDTEYDSRTPQEWVGLGVEDGTLKGVPAQVLRAAAGGPEAGFVWERCIMTAYDAAAAVYTVTISRTAATAAVPRIFLLFDAEDPEIFAQRVSAACELRKQTEGQLRYSLCADCMPADTAITDLDAAMADRLLAAASEGPFASAAGAGYLERLVAEVDHSYARANNTMSLQSVIHHDPESFTTLMLPPVEEAPAPATGMVAVPAYDFQAARRAIGALSFTQSPAVVTLLAKVRAECQKAAAVPLFNLSSTKPVTLEDFQLMQVQAYEHLNGYLRNAWGPNCRNTIASDLARAGKGWFNLQEADQHAYEVGKLRRLCCLVRQMMRDTLRTIVEGAMDSLAATVEKASERLLQAASLEWPGADLASTAFKPPTAPMFYLELLVDTDTQRLSFSTPTGPFESAVLSLFEQAVSQTSGLPDVEPQLMKHLFWVGTPVLETVESGERRVVEKRDRVQHCIRTSVKPLLAYLRLYEQFNDVVELDVAIYLQEFQQEDREAGDVRRECLRHLRRGEEIEEAIPSSVDIGLFHVSCDRLRRELVKKCKDTSARLLQFLSEKLRSQADDICASFQKMCNRLRETPADIEALTDTREYMKSVPDSVRTYQGMIKRALSDWDLLEEFNISMSDDDSRVRWATYGWPKRIEEQLESTKTGLVEAEASFKAGLVEDQNEFGQQIEGLQMIVSGFGSHTDIKKSATVASEVRKIQAELKEAQSNQTLYNNRERLVNEPVTDYSHLTKCIKAFDPYAALWITCDDWKHQHKVGRRRVARRASGSARVAGGRGSMRSSVGCHRPTCPG